MALALTAAMASCGPSGEGGGGIVEISSARWTDSGGVEIEGSWSRGVATPPFCALLSEPDGQPLSRLAASVEESSFSAEFDAGELNGGERYAFCSVSINPGKEIGDTVELAG